MTDHKLAIGYLHIDRVPMCCLPCMTRSSVLFRPYVDFRVDIRRTRCRGLCVARATSRVAVAFAGDRSAVFARGVVPGEPANWTAEDARGGARSAVCGRDLLHLQCLAT